MSNTDNVQQAIGDLKKVLRLADSLRDGVEYLEGLGKLDEAHALSERKLEEINTKITDAQQELEHAQELIGSAPGVVEKATAKAIATIEQAKAEAERITQQAHDAASEHTASIQSQVTQLLSDRDDAQKMLDLIKGQLTEAQTELKTTQDSLDATQQKIAEAKARAIAELS